MKLILNLILTYVEHNLDRNQAKLATKATNNKIRKFELKTEWETYTNPGTPNQE